MPLCHMENQTLKYPQTNKRIYQFQVGFFGLPKPNTHREFIYQVFKLIPNIFNAETMKSIINSYETKNACIIPVIMIYKYGNLSIIQCWGLSYIASIHNIPAFNTWVYNLNGCLCRVFLGVSLESTSGNFIPGVLMNIMSCDDF